MSVSHLDHDHDVCYDWSTPLLHTHSKSSLDINKVFQHLLLWLSVIRMQPHTKFVGLTVTEVVGDSLGF